MKEATRAGIHIDRSASAWLIRRFIDHSAEFAFVNRPDDLLPDAISFDMRAVGFSHHGNDCTFETLLRRHDLADPVLWRIAEITGPLVEPLRSLPPRTLRKEPS